MQVGIGHSLISLFRDIPRMSVGSFKLLNRIAVHLFNTRRLPVVG